ncbi:hypothetical protein, partial [Shewanella algae]|uniref:hypothetical protein n=1 Tax=Shewanella algae TaxID=38313 RepID=UPI00313E0422
AQLAYWVTDRIAPFVRFESANYNNLDLYFLAQTNGIPYMKSVIGARYNLSEQAAIKVEFSKKDLLRDTPSIPQGSVDQFH